MGMSLSVSTAWKTLLLKQINAYVQGVDLA